MGEHATFNGSTIKIGTCESMYYLRADQRHLIHGYHFDESLRYRFPFPDEDDIEPRVFEDYDRGVRIPGWHLPTADEGFEGHYSVQFSAEPGYLLSIPCPEQFAGEDNRGLRTVLPDGLTVGRNGWHGGAMVKHQRILNGVTMTVVACGSCGAAWRLETLENAKPVIDAFRAEADRQEWRRGYDFEADKFTEDYGFEPAHCETHRKFLHAMADRIEAGYTA